MRKVSSILLLLVAMAVCSSAHVYSYPNGGYAGAVNNPITNVTLKTYPDNGSDFNHVLISGTTAIASDWCVWIAIPGVDFTEADVSRKVCSSTITTGHSILVDGFGPYTYAFYVSACTTGPGCARTSGNISSSPYGTSVANLFQFANADPCDPIFGGCVIGSFDWRGWITGPHLHLMRTHQYLLSVNGIKTAGADPNLVYITDVKVDGQSCLPFVLGGNTCGSTHFTIQPTCGYSTAPNTTTKNYYQNVFTSGARSGQGFCYNTALGYETVQLRLLPDSSATTVSHSISMSLLHALNDGTTVGSTQTMTYSVTVDAAPAFTYIAPTIFTAMSYLAPWKANLYGTDITTGGAHVGVAQNYKNYKAANTTVPGVYNNDNASSTMYTINPWGLFTYRGADQVPLTSMEFLDYLDANAGDVIFTPTHSYSYGDLICTNGAAGCRTGATNYYLVVTDSAGCTSGASLGSVPDPGNSYLNGSCHLGNVGNDSWWLEMTERTATQQRDFLLSLGKYTIAQEWATFANIMWGMRKNGVSFATSRDETALEFMLSPFCPNGGNCHGSLTLQRSEFSVARQPFGLRSLPYDLENFTAYWTAMGIKPIDHGVDEPQVRKDMVIQTLNHLTEYSTADGVNSTFACCVAFPTFDVGLAFESLYELCAAEKLETGTCDAAIPVTIARTVDWLQSHEWNLLGTNFSFPYNLWTEPFVGGTAYNQIQPELNPLTGIGYTYLWAMSGDACTLPTSGTPCKTAADLVWQHAHDRPPSSSITGKIDSELYKNWLNHYYMRLGVRTAFQPVTLPAFNPLTTFPGKMEPYPQGEWRVPPQASPSSNQAIVVWYSYEQPASIYVKYGTSASTVNTTSTCSPATITLFDSVSGLYLLTCYVTGLTPHTHYYFGVGAIDAGGNNGYSQYDILAGDHAPWQFTTLGTPITITGSLPNGQQGIFYTATLGASGGIGPYTFSTTVCFGVPCLGHDINGLSMSSGGTYSGIPNRAGTASLSVRACDSTLTCGTTPFLVVIAPLAGLQSTQYGTNSMGITFH